MPTVLIADSGKSSLVMTSEVFKDKVQGIEVLVADSGKMALDLLATKIPDIIVVDFDLPDVDGVTLVNAMRQTYSGPILMTAYPDATVEKAVKAELFAFRDAGEWLAKPVSAEILGQRIERFLLRKERVTRRFRMSLETTIVGKGAGRGKRAPKSQVRIVNMSLSGACFKVGADLPVKSGQEMTLTLPAAEGTAAKKSKPAPAGKKAPVPAMPASDGTKLRATIAWSDKKKKLVGVSFEGLSDSQKKGLEKLLSSATAID